MPSLMPLSFFCKSSENLPGKICITAKVIIFFDIVVYIKDYIANAFFSKSYLFGPVVTSYNANNSNVLKPHYNSSRSACLFTILLKPIVANLR